MTLKECADVLRSFIRHREKMHEQEVIFERPDGTEEGRGRINPEADDLYQAAKIALECVENAIK